MTLLLQRVIYSSLFECRRLPRTHRPIRGNWWLAVLRVGPWSLILAERGKS